LFLTLLAIGLLFWGSSLGAICIGFAFSVHVSSVLDILNRQGTVRFPSMVLTSLLAALVLGVFLYWPIGWAASHVAAVREYRYDSPLFRQSDVVLINEWAFLLREPRPGDVVLYETNFVTGVHVGGAFNARFVLGENETIERVVGGPGDHVLWDHGSLTINDSPVAWTPLLHQRLPDRLEITVPENSYLILPSTSQASTGDGSSQAWKARGLVSRERIEGMAYLRLQPLSRLWLIR
jgi:signal peptidase I